MRDASCFWRRREDGVRWPVIITAAESPDARCRHLFSSKFSKERCVQPLLTKEVKADFVDVLSACHWGWTFRQKVSTDC